MGTIHLGSSWVIFSGNPDYNHGYDISPAAIKSQEEAHPSFIRLLDESQEEKLIKELKIETEEEEKKELEDVTMAGDQRLGH